MFYAELSYAQRRQERARGQILGAALRGLAAMRAETLTKYYGVLALATKDVYERFTAPPPSRLIDRIVVKGKTTPLELFELRHKFSTKNFDEIARDYSEALALYQQGQFAEAQRRFLALSTCDRPSKVMAQRCAELALHQPPEWNGIFIMTEK